MDKTVWTTHSKPLSPEEKSNRSKQANSCQSAKKVRAGMATKKRWMYVPQYAGKQIAMPQAHQLPRRASTFQYFRVADL